jgi:hypothetical protein
MLLVLGIIFFTKDKNDISYKISIPAIQYNGEALIIINIV